MSIQPCRNDVQGGDCHGELSPLLGGKRAAPATLLHSPAIRSRRCRAGGMSDCDSLGRPLRSAFLRQGSRRGREDAARPCTALRGVPARTADDGPGHVQTGTQEGRQHACAALGVRRAVGPGFHTIILGPRASLCICSSCQRPFCDTVAVANRRLLTDASAEL